jgi:NAD(P)-dependent dehydrogenase (short-subunit alcohol dehydrogenase family)
MGDREVVVVTGGASGFGLAFAAACARRGMDVALLDRDEDRVQAEAGSLGALGVAVDVTAADQVEAAASEVEERFGRADVVISNVGLQLFGAVETFTDDEWRWLLDVNVVGAARTTRAFLPLLRQSTDPRLAFTTSTSVLEPAARLGAYQASKFAVWGLAETLRLELAGVVKVTVVFPSGMMSRHLESSADAQPHHLRREVVTNEDLEAMMASNPTMASAIATPEDAAANTVDAVLTGEPYVITHGDLVDAVTTRSDALRHAAERSRDR